MAKILTYTGKGLENGDPKLNLSAYIPSPELVRAVNVALYLRKRPLLLMGEPGVGKTCLAESVAYELLGAQGMKDCYFRWNIKSTSKAKEGLYRYDSFRRLADSQILKDSNDRKQLDNLKLGDKGSYFQRGYLAEAFAKSTENQRCVLLIDEIDKADIDFPNDLLNELENYNFTIPETGEEVKMPKNFAYPLIIITSNRERELPPAFLRRCLYHYIEFPDDETLRKIILKVFNDKQSSEIVEKALSVFRKQRDATINTEKRPSTSELIDWVGVLKYYEEIKKQRDVTSPNNEIIKCLDLLGTDKIPFAEVLLKTYETFKNNG